MRDPRGSAPAGSRTTSLAGAPDLPAPLRRLTRCRSFVSRSCRREPRSSSGVTLVLAVLVAGCGPSSAPLLIDLLHELPRAQVRSVSPESARIDLVPGDAGLVPALVMPAPSRVTWPVQLTERAELTARVAMLGDADQGVTLRIGISDKRNYDELTRIRIRYDRYDRYDGYDGYKNTCLASDPRRPFRLLGLALQPLLPSRPKNLEFDPQRRRHAWGHVGLVRLGSEGTMSSASAIFNREIGNRREIGESGKGNW